jgi:hypothetical protein
VSGNGYDGGMGRFSTVGIWTVCPTCADAAVAVVQFCGHADSHAQLLDFRCPADCDVSPSTVLSRLRLTLDRAS